MNRPPGRLADKQAPDTASEQRAADLLRTLQAPPRLDAAADARLERRVAQMGASPPARRRPWLLMTVPAALALVIFVAMPGSRDDNGIRSRGSERPLMRSAVHPEPELLTFRIGPGGRSEPLGEVIRRDDELAFAYRTDGSERRVLVFARDEEGRVYWYHPAWNDPTENPAAVALSRDPGVHELPAAVSQPLQGRRVEICGVFTTSELRVRDVEQGLLVTASGCGKLAPLEGLRCPCATGFVCCENRCRSAKACPSSSESDPDGGTQARPDGPPTTGGKPDGPTIGVGQDAPREGTSDLRADTPADGGSVPPRYVDISVGERHVCVVRGDQSVGCWGNNEVTDSVAPAGRFKQVSTGHSSKCGLAVDGKIHCWGFCTYDPTNPCNRPPAGTFSQLSTGSDDRCALALDGTPTCWGSSAQQPPADSFQKVAVGKGFGCGLKGQTVTCWGFGAAGMQIPKQAFVDLAAAADWACGVTVGGAVLCWGTPPLAPLMPALIGLSSLTLGPNVGCALDGGGSLKCWAKTGAPTPLPSSTRRFTKFSLGNEHACGISTGGELICPEPESLLATHPPSLPVIDFCANREAVRITNDHRLDFVAYGGRVQRSDMARVFCRGPLATCALTRTGDLHCWGDQAPLSSAPGPFTEVAIAGEAVCALRADKTVKCFGAGLNSLGPAGTFRAIAGSEGYVCALRTDGSMACWGTSDPEHPIIPGKFVSLSAGLAGPCALDESGRISFYSPMVSPGPPPAGKFTQISMGKYHACGLSDGLAICWGIPGIGLVRARQAPPGPFTAIQAGDNVSCGLRPDGKLVCWGALEWPDDPRPTR